MVTWRTGSTILMAGFDKVAGPSSGPDNGNISLLVSAAPGGAGEDATAIARIAL